MGKGSGNLVISLSIGLSKFPNENILKRSKITSCSIWVNYKVPRVWIRLVKLFDSHWCSRLVKKKEKNQPHGCLKEAYQILFHVEVVECIIIIGPTSFKWGIEDVLF